MSAPIIKNGSETAEKPTWLQVVPQHVGSLRDGVVQTVIHDSQVTQIEKTERVRLDKARATGN